MANNTKVSDPITDKPESELVHKFKMVVGGFLVIGDGLLNVLRGKSSTEIMPLNHE